MCSEKAFFSCNGNIRHSLENAEYSYIYIQCESKRQYTCIFSELTTLRSLYAVEIRLSVCRLSSVCDVGAPNFVATSFPYPTARRSIAGDVPIYLKLAFKVTHLFRKRQFPKLSFKSAIGLGAFWSCFSPYDTLAIH